jgi:hypothetical protein
VRAVCDEEISEWSEPHLFATQCETFNLPYLENFDTYGVAIPPACWISNGSINVVDWMPQSPPYHLNMAAGDENVLFVAAPKFTSPINQIKLSLQMRRGQLANGLDVGIMTDVHDPSTFQLVSHLTGAQNNEYTDELIYFNGNYPAESRITFKYWGSWHGLMLDNILFEPIPNCPEPFNVQASSIDVYETTISWLQAGTANQWELSFGVPGFNPDIEGNLISGITNAYYLLVGLQANTAYEIYVRSICGTDYSEWSNSKVITTLPRCQAPYGLNASNVSQHNAHISWMQPGSALSWEVLYGIAGFNPENEGTMAVSITTQEYQLTDLQHSQYYEVYVRAICDDEASSWSTIVVCNRMWRTRSSIFRKLQSKHLRRLPYAGIQLYMGEGNGSITVSQYEHCLIISNGNWFNDSRLVILPQIDTENNPVKISFKAYHDFGSSILEIGIMENPSDPGSFIPKALSY